MNTSCNHTLYHMDKFGRPMGSWVVVEENNRKKVICGVCRKFYGYVKCEARPKRKRTDRIKAR